MSHEAHLRSFFAELERLQPPKDWGLSHAIAYENGVIYVLVSMGDVRAKVGVRELDPDPIKMAATIIAMRSVSTTLRQVA